MNSSRLSPEDGPHIISEAFGRTQQLVFTGSLIICNGAFNKVPHAIQLVMVLQISEVPVHSTQDVERIEVPVGQLCGANHVYCCIRSSFQLRIRVVRQRITDSLDPLREIGVLKNKTVEPIGIGVFRIIGKHIEATVRIPRGLEPAAITLDLTAPLVQSCGCSEVVHAIARIGTRNLVVEDTPLIR